MLIPDCFGNCQLDYRLPWLTFILLNSLDYNTNIYAEQILLSSFASQLEQADLWHFAILISMMNRDDK